jgi:fumarate reductase subunit C
MYMVREATAIFAAAWVVVFLIQIPMMAGGLGDPRLYVGWLAFIRSPLWVIFSLTAFCFVMYHAVTFLGLMGTVMATRIGHLRVGGPLIVGPMYLVWIGITLLLILLVLLIPQLGG